MPPIANAWLVTWIAVAAVMALLWLRQTRTQNANAVDAAWSLSFTLTALSGWLFLETSSWRAVLVGALLALWSLRLGGYLLFTRVLNHQAEDSRYHRLRTERQWDQRHFFVMYQFQALLVAALSVPLLVAMQAEAPFFRIQDFFAIVIWSIAIIGESLADRQLHKFLKNPASKGKTCQLGLWRYSRHPNYFFEWLHWWTYVFFALGTPYALWTLLGPVLMLWFLVKITGIAASERQSLKSRPDYAEYQRTTSAFVPWLRTK